MIDNPTITGGSGLGSLLRQIKEEEEIQPAKIRPAALPTSPLRQLVQEPLAVPEAIGSAKIVAMKPEVAPAAAPPVIAPLAPPAMAPGVIPGAVVPPVQFVPPAAPAAPPAPAQIPQAPAAAPPAPSKPSPPPAPGPLTFARRFTPPKPSKVGFRYISKLPQNLIPGGLYG